MNDVHEQYTLDFTTSYGLHLIYEYCTCSVQMEGIKKTWV
jgi:hypothetical protein